MTSWPYAIFRELWMKQEKWFSEIFYEAGTLPRADCTASETDGVTETQRKHC